MKITLTAIAILFAVGIGLPVQPCADDKKPFENGRVLSKSVPVSKPALISSSGRSPTSFSTPVKSTQTQDRTFKPQSMQDSNPGSESTSTLQRFPTTDTAGTSPNMVPVPTTTPQTQTESPMPGSSISLPGGVDASARGNTSMSLGAGLNSSAFAANTVNNNTILGATSATGGAMGVVAPMESLLGLQNLMNPAPSPAM